MCVRTRFSGRKEEFTTETTIFPTNIGPLADCFPTNNLPYQQRTGVRSCKKSFSNRIIRGGGCSDKNSKQIHAWGRIIRAQTLGRVIIAKSDNTIQRWGNLKVPTFRIWLAFTSYVIVRRTSGNPARTDPQNEGEDPQSRTKQC